MEHNAFCLLDDSEESLELDLNQNDAINSLVSNRQIVEIPILLYFQPTITPALLNCGIRKFIFVDSAPLSTRPVQHGRWGPSSSSFIKHLSKTYEKLGFYLDKVYDCAPRRPLKFTRPVHCGCFQSKSPPYTAKPFKFVFVRAFDHVSVSHYVSSGFSSHMSYELENELQHATILAVGKKWVPPHAILQLFHDPIPRSIWIDVRLQKKVHGFRDEPTSTYVQLC